MLIGFSLTVVPGSALILLGKIGKFVRSPPQYITITSQEEGGDEHRTCISTLLFCRRWLKSFGMRAHLLRENPFDMQAGRDRFFFTSLASAAASDRSLNLANRVEMTCLAISSWRTSINFWDRSTPLLLSLFLRLSQTFCRVCVDRRVGGKGGKQLHFSSSKVFMCCSLMHRARSSSRQTTTADRCPSQRKEGGETQIEPLMMSLMKG